MRGKRIWALHVSTFRGVSPGAMHSYGVLEGPDTVAAHEATGEPCSVAGQKYEVMRVLDAESAAQLNQLNEDMGRPFGLDHSAGEYTQQFDSNEDVEAAGLAVFEAIEGKDPEAVLLLTSGFAGAGPAKPLAGPAEVVQELREIWELDESEDSWNWTPVREQASELWHAVMDRLDPPEPDDVRHGAGPGWPKPPRPLTARATRLEDGSWSAEIVPPYAWELEQ